MLLIPYEGMVHACLDNVDVKSLGLYKSRENLYMI